MNSFVFFTIQTFSKLKAKKRRSQCYSVHTWNENSHPNPHSVAIAQAVHCIMFVITVVVASRCMHVVGMHWLGEAPNCRWQKATTNGTILRISSIFLCNPVHSTVLFAAIQFSIHFSDFLYEFSSNFVTVADTLARHTTPFWIYFFHNLLTLTAGFSMFFAKLKWIFS